MSPGERTLRWVAFLPAAIAAAVTMNFVLNAVFDAAGLPPSSMSTVGVAREAVLAFALALTFTLVPAIVSPRPWTVGIVMFAVGLIIRVAPIASAMTVPYQRARLRSFAVALGVTLVAHAVGGIAGLFLIRRLAQPRTIT